MALSYSLNRRFYVPFQWIFYNLESYSYRQDTLYRLIIPTTSISKLSIKYLRSFKMKHNNVKLYALVTDSMHAGSPHMNLVRDKLLTDVWEMVLTYDRYDAKEYGFTWFGYTYYSYIETAGTDHVLSDIYYVGFNKGGREKKVLGIYQYLTERGIKCRFDVVSNEKGCDLKKKIPYPEVLEKVKSSNCILEILQEGQETQSIRYFEALVYNKKLLTNNRHVSELPYYDERFMKYFKDFNEIDAAWISERAPIEYGYRGEYSPIHLIDFIRKSSDGG